MIKKYSHRGRETLTQRSRNTDTREILTRERETREIEREIQEIEKCAHKRKQTQTKTNTNPHVITQTYKHTYTRVPIHASTRCNTLQHTHTNCQFRNACITIRTTILCELRTTILSRSLVCIRYFFHVSIASPSLWALCVCVCGGVTNRYSACRRSAGGEIERERARAKAREREREREEMCV